MNADSRRITDDQERQLRDLEMQKLQQELQREKDLNREKMEQDLRL